MIHKRLQDLRKTLNLSKEQLSTNCDLTVRTYSSYETGERKLTIDFIRKLSDLYNVNLNWLISAKGEMFNTPPFEQEEDRLTQKVEAVLKKYNLI